MKYIKRLLHLYDFEHKPNLDSINLLWYAIMTMDILEVYILLQDEYDYNNLTKTEFVNVLGSKFKKHKVLGDSEFCLTLNECYKCHKGEIICEFNGVDSGIGLSLYFEIKNSEIVGLEFCDAYGKVEDLNDYYNWEEN